MLEDYPIKFNTTEFTFFPSTWEESYGVVDEVFETEAGTDQVLITRAGKMSYSVGFCNTSGWVAAMLGFAGLDSFTLSVYDPVDEAYATHTVRMRNLKYKLVKNSAKLSTTEGLWDVSFTLEEF